MSELCTMCNPIRRRDSSAAVRQSKPNRNKVTCQWRFMSMPSKGVQGKAMAWQRTTTKVVVASKTNRARARSRHDTPHHLAQSLPRVPRRTSVGEKSDKSESRAIVQGKWKVKSDRTVCERHPMGQRLFYIGVWEVE